MFHIVFQTADVEILKKVIELDESLSGDIYEIKDDYAVGPLDGIDTEEGWTARQNWWSDLLSQSPYAKDELVGSFDDRKTATEIKEKLLENEGEELWIWMGQNGHDVCGYYWLVSQLQEFQGRIVVLYLNNLPFINEKGHIFYPTNLHEIQPKEFLKAKKLNRKITSSEFEVDADEWKRSIDEKTLVRILEGGKKIAGKSENFYDKDILAALTSEWQKGNKAMHNILGKMKIKTGDVFLLWRMKHLAENGLLEIQGDTSKGWKDFEIRLKNTMPELTDV